MLTVSSTRLNSFLSLLNHIKEHMMENAPSTTLSRAIMTSYCGQQHDYTWQLRSLYTWNIYKKKPSALV